MTACSRNGPEHSKMSEPIAARWRASLFFVDQLGAGQSQWGPGHFLAPRHCRWLITKMISVTYPQYEQGHALKKSTTLAWPTPTPGGGGLGGGSGGRPPFEETQANRVGDPLHEWEGLAQRARARQTVC